MRLFRTLVLLSAAVVPIAVGGTAAAQTADVSPPLPNVLLLVDTSGSMEYNIDGSKVQCKYVDASLSGEPAPGETSPPQKSRWTQLVEVMTGTIDEYHCYTQDRRTNAFRQEFKLGASDAADYNYVVPYHRFLSGDAAVCTIGPGTADADPYKWPAAPFSFHAYNATSTACSGISQSAKDGLLDAFRDRVRFALMTYDTQPDPGTGVVGGATDYPTARTLP